MRRPRRLEGIPGFGIDKVAAATRDDPGILRLENLDTDIRPCPEALDATRAAIERDDRNSYLPFDGLLECKEAVAAYYERRGGGTVDPESQIVITQGEGDGILNSLLALTDPGDEVVVTDPTYAGAINRVRLVGCTPRFAPFESSTGEWRLDLDALRDAVGDRTSAMLIVDPAMPSGAVLTRDEWDAIAELCVERDLWLIFWTMMEGIVFGGREQVHPASLPGMAERTVTFGSVSHPQRLIGWRVGWTVSPAEVKPDLALVHIYNGICPSGIGQAAAIAALGVDDVAQAVAEWERRHDTVVAQCEGLPVVPASGGWSLLLDAEALGTTAPELSDRLLAQRVAATPMTAWGETVAPRHVRFVYSNEPVERLELLGERLRAAV